MTKKIGNIGKAGRSNTTGKRAVGLVALVAGSMFVSGANAQEVDAEVYVGGKARVNQATKLRTYSEEVAAASCRLSAGINTAQAEGLSLIHI